MQIHGPVTGHSSECERILRSLPGWFGVEKSLIEYARTTEVLPTFVAHLAGSVVGFVTLQLHTAESAEVHCIAVQSGCRGQGVGRALHAHAERWLISRDIRLLQVKTLAPAHASREYAETRAFYRSLGYIPLEVFAELWGPGLPVLQLAKCLRGPD